MGVPPSETKRLSYWEYTALRYGWNERHKVEGDDQGDPVEPPSADFVRQRQRELFADGIAGTARP